MNTGCELVILNVLELTRFGEDVNTTMPVEDWESIFNDLLRMAGKKSVTSFTDGKLQFNIGKRTMRPAPSGLPFSSYGSRPLSLQRPAFQER